jgi:hypothetical protein
MNSNRLLELIDYGFCCTNASYRVEVITPAAGGGLARGSAAASVGDRAGRQRSTGAQYVSMRSVLVMRGNILIVIDARPLTVQLIS